MRHSMRHSMRLRTAVLATALLSACTGGIGGSRPVPADAPTVPEMLRDLGTDSVRQMTRGYLPGRNGQVVLVPKPWNTIAQWPGGLRGAKDPRTTHAGPWDYLQRVPIILDGPGYVRPQAVLDRPVDVTDIPATLADLLGSGWEAQDGEPLSDALLSPSQRSGPPKVIVFVAHDGAGWNTLQRWPDAWPAQRRIAREGATYVNATIGSAPPVTAPIHANMGTGTYPRTHGIIENTGRLPDGSLGELFFYEEDPRLLAAETIGDVWDRENGNEPWVGLLAYESWHLGMLGKGAQAPGGDRDVAVLWDFRDSQKLFTNEDVYSMPGYLEGREPLERRLRELDLRDGALDDRWLNVDLADDFFVPGTPAFVAYTGDLLMEMLEREPIGAGGPTDLLFVELKATDVAGHLWGIESDQFRQALRAQDRVVERLVEALDEKVGRGSYVLAISADHGFNPPPHASGGLRIDRFRLERVLNDRFGGEIVEAIHPDDIYLYPDVMVEQGVTAADVARVIADVRFREVAPEGTDLDALPEKVVRSRVFAAAIPGEVLVNLTEAEIDALGPSAYPEGDLTSVPPFADLLRR